MTLQINPSLKLIEASSETDFQEIRTLFTEYAKWLDENDPEGIDLCFQDFDTELATLPGKYAPPEGRVYLALYDDQAAGCVGVRGIEPGICEMKRLYVRPEFLGNGIGKVLVQAIIDAGKDLGYQAMRLDTLPYMKAALALYKAHGFRKIDSYYDTPLNETIFLECDLTTN